MRHSPPHERDPEVGHKEHDKEDRVDVLVESADGSQDHDPFVAYDQHDPGGHDVETHGVGGRC